MDLSILKKSCAVITQDFIFLPIHLYFANRDAINIFSFTNLYFASDVAINKNSKNILLLN